MCRALAAALAVAVACAATIGAQGGQPGWAPPPFPRPTSQAGMVYDEARQRLVLYGGFIPCTQSCSSLHHSLWDSDGTAWVLRRAPTSPSSWEGAGLAYDSGRQRVVLFGGRASAPLGSPARALDETWEWDGSRWTQRTLAVSPGQRSRHAVAYDSARGRVVLFGGSSNLVLSGNEMSDTWEWDGTTWTQLQPPQRPAARQGHKMVYDRARGKVVLFGGRDTAPRRGFGDTWEWDGSNWTRLTPASPPQARDGHSMAYDIARQRVVLFGGLYRPSLFTQTALFDTWEWDGTTWAQRSQSGGPGAPLDHAMAYDEGSRTTVLFGGSNAGQFSGDTWEWDGTTWALRTKAPVEPSAPPVLMYDRLRERTILVGSPQMWEFDGSSWQGFVPATTPPGRFQFGMVWEIARQRGLLFGGTPGGYTALADTWEWNGVTWSQRQPATSPPPRAGHGMAYDAARSRVVVFGGTVPAPFGQFPKNDTWEWDGTTWLQRNPTVSPSARGYPAMTWDPIRQRVVLFGGRYRTLPLGETWEWDGTNWLRKNPTRSPSPRAFAGMTWDPTRGRVVLFGGAVPNPYYYFYLPTRYFDETWEWDGTDWTQIVGKGPRPVAREHPGLVFDRALQSTILFGGTGPTSIGATTPTRVYGTWKYTASLARSLGYGAGCAGSAGTPRLGSFGAAVLGRANFALDLAAARPQAAAVVLLSTAPASVTLSGDCALLVDLTSPWAALLGLTNASGTASFGLPLPTTPALLGQTLWSQSAILDPAGVWQGLAFSGGLSVTLGY